MLCPSWTTYSTDTQAGDNIKIIAGEGIDDDEEEDDNEDDDDDPSKRTLSILLQFQPNQKSHYFLL